MTAIAGYYLCLVMLTSNDYVHLDNLSDVSAYRTAVKP